MAARNVSGLGPLA